MAAQMSSQMTVSDFLAIRWGEVEGPLIQPPRFSPIIADPSFLLPEETPDGGWELFAHSAWGIHRYSSADGIEWRDRGLGVRNAMRPLIRRIGPDTAADGASDSASGSASGSASDSLYLLCFEAYRPFALPLSALPFRKKWSSTIGLSTSADLVRWSPAATIAAPLLPWMSDPVLGSSVSNPCLVEARPGDWRLYHSASLSWIPDCGFCEPRHIACARGPSPEGPFEPLPKPIIESALGDLGAGSIKVLRLSDGWVGLQNRIFRDPVGRSRSAIFVLRSEDGLAWRSARPAPLLTPQDGWTSSHVYACDCRFRQADGRWYLYFNARDGWRVTEGVERIGRIVGEP